MCGCEQKHVQANVIEVLILSVVQWCGPPSYFEMQLPPEMLVYGDAKL